MANTDLSYVRTDFHDTLPPPASQVGIIGWMRTNLFSSWLNTILTLFGIYLIYLVVPPVIKFAFLDATWTGDNREACLANTGACWAYVKAYYSQFIYGRYPDPERWRVDVVFAAGILLLVPMLVPKVPFKAVNAILLLGVYPVVAFILLTGGHLGLDGFLLPESLIAPSTLKFWIDFLIVAAVAVGITKVITSLAESKSNAPAIAIAIIFALVAVVMVAVDINFGLEPVETSKWGGLLVTLVVAITGITASLPLGVLLALGRRSVLPVVRLCSIVFIEFWRGVPLITVLFMSSVMLPLFLPEGVTFDKLLRALIGVALFSAAYMAEVVRGGLQAIPKGQHEGAKALGLTYWQMMGLIILPQALKLVIPGIVNSFIALFKDTTLVLIIGLFDLLGQIQSSFTDPTWSTPFTSHTGYMFAAIIFWIFCFAMSRYSIFMERRLHTGHKR